MKWRAPLNTVIAVVVLGTLVGTPASGQWNARREIRLPDPPGYLTLKCDFHVHTVFSDGEVWPPVRIEEAWREGLDAIAITDHIEYQPHAKDVPTNFGRPYELALGRAQELDIILIRGAEITKGEPPGHFNAIFVEDIGALNCPDYKDAVREANRQGAFVFWNHPGWKQPGNRSVWYAQQDTLFRLGLLKGLEVVNSDTYYPEVFGWCLEKKLTVVGNSDIHAPVAMEYDPAGGQRRPITLVFAKKRSAEAIREALFAGRTAVLFNGLLIGKEEFVRPLFERSIELKTPEVPLKPKGASYAQVYNSSDVDFHLAAAGTVEGVSFPDSVDLWAGRTVLLPLRKAGANWTGRKEVELPYVVKNVLVAPGQGLRTTVRLKVKVEE
ncbi:MAG: Sb-PDE family phosphodiesterase [candidate division KSB1 bacterium]|nr:Sb-PDE family phosphodiesterase [candidate division KSB1 bacterium]